MEDIEARRAYQRERQKAYRKKYAEAHREELKAKTKAYYDARKEEQKAKQKAYYEKNKERINAINNARRRQRTIEKRQRAAEKNVAERLKLVKLRQDFLLLQARERKDMLKQLAIERYGYYNEFRDYSYLLEPNGEAIANGEYSKHTKRKKKTN